MRLEGGDLALRPFTEADVPAIAAACQDPEIPRWTSVPSPYGEEDARAFVRGLGNERSFAVVDSETDELVGSVGFWLVRAMPDPLFFILRFDGEGDFSAIHGGDTDRSVDLHSHRRGGDVVHVEVRAQALVAGGQQVLHRGERRRLDEVDHDRRGEDMHLAAADARRGVLLADHQLGGSGQPGCDLHPGIVFTSAR